MNAIYLHPLDGFTFLENVPEKPKHIDMFTKAGIDKFEAYERTLAEAIEKRMVIGNPEVFEVHDSNWDDKKFIYFDKHNPIELKEGELYPWPGTYGKVDMCGSRPGKTAFGCSTCHGECISVVPTINLIAPKSEIQTLEVSVCAKCGGTGFIGNGPTSFNKQKCTCNSEPVNSSMSYSEGETENSTLPKELQSEPVVSQDQEPEAVRFANWISLENWSPMQTGGTWCKSMGYPHFLRKTTVELYELFTRNP